MKTTQAKPDYEIARDEMREFFATLNLEAKATGGQWERDDEKWEHRRYSVQFSRRGIMMHPVCFVWKAGTGIKRAPDCAEVLACCCRDYHGAEQTNFESWAADYGYDADSRKAEGIYRECLAIGAKLKELGLTRQQTAKLAEFSSRL